MKPQKPYIISNRNFDDAKDPTYTSIAPQGKLTFFGSDNYDPAKPRMTYDEWKVAVSKDHNLISGDQIMIFIHGYANPWATTVVGPLVDMVSNFWTGAGSTCTTTNFVPYDGPIIMFDWPSDDDSTTKAGQIKAYNDAKDKAKKTATYFGANPDGVNLEKVISDLRGLKAGVKINVVCHSMGNLVWLHGAGLLTPGSVDECLMNAAAISRDSIDPASRLGSDIMKTCKRVTIYYSNADDTLLAGSVIDQWKELGRDGPDYSKTGAWAEQLYAVDCTDVVNRNNLHGAKLVHIAYYSIPQVLYDFIAVLSGKKQKIIKNRTAIGGTNNVGYKMMINSAQAD